VHLGVVPPDREAAIARLKAAEPQICVCQRRLIVVAAGRQRLSARATTYRAILPKAV
jgi:hypothetical protein